MATAEIPLLQQARALIQQHELDVQQQAAANQICQESRLICEDLLRQNGSLERSIGTRIFKGVFYGIPVFGWIGLGLDELMARKLSGYHAWETDDRVRWKTVLNGSEPEVPVEIIAEGGPDPAKASSIAVKLGGLPRSIELFKYGSTIHSDIPHRSASLEEARNWHQIVAELRDRQVQSS